MDTAQWPQGIGVMKTMEIGSRHQQQQQQQAMLGGGESRKATTTTRPTKDHKAAALNCPRCNSSNTKFCYYNNYSLSQPRYFCKTCRRYWTEGGSLRNVPVGGGSRKNKRSSLSHLQPNSSNSTSSSSQNPKIIHEGQDLNLAYPPPSSTNTTTLEDHHHHNYNNIPKFIQLPYLDPKNPHPSNPNNPNPNFSAMELLKTDEHHHENMYSSSGFGGMQEFKQPTLSFSLDGFDQNGYGGGGGGGGGVQQQNGGARLLFPFEDLKNVSSTTSEFLDDHHHNRGGQGQQQGGGDSTSNGYWSGMLGGGSW